MMEQQSFHPLDYMAAVNRRKWWFIVPLFACIALGVAVLQVWPKKYLSRAAIAVQSPTLSGDLLRGVSSMDPVERQRAISQLLLSPTVLERVIADNGRIAVYPLREYWLDIGRMEDFEQAHAEFHEVFP